MRYKDSETVRLCLTAVCREAVKHNWTAWPSAILITFLLVNLSPCPLVNQIINYRCKGTKKAPNPDVYWKKQSHSDAK